MWKKCVMPSAFNNFLVISIFLQVWKASKPTRQKKWMTKFIVCAILCGILCRFWCFGSINETSYLFLKHRSKGMDQTHAQAYIHANVIMLMKAQKFSCAHTCYYICFMEAYRSTQYVRTAIYLQITLGPKMLNSIDSSFMPFSPCISQ